MGRAFLLTMLMSVTMFGPASSAASSQMPQDYSGYTVSNLTVKGLTSMEPEEFLYLLDLPVGVTVSRQRIRDGIDRVFRTRNFLDIKVEVVDLDASTRSLNLLVTAVERTRIARIKIRGDFPTSRREIRRVLELGPGDEFRPEHQARYEGRLRDLLAEHGFPSAVIHIHATPTRRSRFVNVHIRIDAGEPDRIRDIQTQGSGNLDRLRRKLGLDVGDPFDRHALSENLATILADMRDQGYFEAQLPEWVYESGVLSISFHSGPLYGVEFEGNSSVSSRKLRKQFSFESLDAPMTDDTVEDATRRYVRYYRKRGFPFAQVATSFVVAENRTLLSFYIHEGPRVELRSLQLVGVSLPDVEKLKDILGLEEGDHYDATALDDNLSDLISLYKSLGFLGASVLDVSADYAAGPGMVDLIVFLDEGPRTLVTSITFSGNKAFSDDHLFKVASLEAGKPYNEVDAADARFRILEEYSRGGYLGASIWLEPRFSEDMTSVELVFDIVEAEPSHFGKTIIAGNTRTRSELIRKEFDLPEGAPFDYREVLEGRHALHRMGLFRSIRAEPVDGQEEDQDVDMVVHVQEGSFGTVDLGIGYGDYEHLRGFVEVGHNNLNGLNRRLSLRLEASSLSRRGILGYRDPWILADYRLPLRTALLREYVKKLDADTRDLRFESDRTSLLVGVEREFSQTLKGTLNYEYSYVDTYNVRPGEILSRHDVGTLGISSLSPSLARDTRGNPFDPRDGSLTTVTLKVASRALLSEAEFYKATVQASYYRQIFSRLVGAVALRGGIARALGGEDDLPLVERFFLGGGNSVRGFARDSLGPRSADGIPTGGNAFVSFNTELRINLFLGAGLVLFVDGGNVWSRNSDIDVVDLRSAWGVGLRYETPVGPFRLDYGRKFEILDDEDASEIHFSLGHAF